MYDPLFRLCLFEDPNPLAFQSLLVEMQGAKTTTLVIWAPILALIVVVSGSYWIAPGLAVFAGLMQAAFAFLLWRFSEYPGRDHVGRKEVRFPDVRSQFGGDHSHRGRFQGGGNAR